MIQKQQEKVIISKVISWERSGSAVTTQAVEKGRGGSAIGLIQLYVKLHVNVYSRWFGGTQINLAWLIRPLPRHEFTDQRRRTVCTLFLDKLEWGVLSRIEIKGMAKVIWRYLKGHHGRGSAKGWVQFKHAYMYKGIIFRFYDGAYVHKLPKWQAEFV